MWGRFWLPEVHGQPDAHDQLERGDGVEIAGEGLLPRLVPKQRPPGIGPHSAAKERQLQKRRFRNAPSPRLRPRLVDPEGGKGEEVHRDDGRRDVGRGDEGAEGGGERVHAGSDTRKGLRLGCFFGGESS